MVVGWSSILGRRSLGRLERRNRKADFYLGNSRQKFVSLRQRWPASKLKGFLYLHFGSGPTSPSQASAFALIVVRPPLLGAKRSRPNGCRRLALRACEKNCYRTASRYRCAGKAAAYLPASSCSCLAAHDRDWTLPRFAVTFAPCWSGLSANGLSSCSANLASARVSGRLDAVASLLALIALEYDGRAARRCCTSRPIAPTRAGSARAVPCTGAADVGRGFRAAGRRRAAPLRQM